MSDTNVTPVPDDKPAVVEQAAQQLGKQQRTIRDLLQGPEFALAAKQVGHREMRPGRTVRTALMAMTRTPDLAECSKESFFKALLECTSYGLEPDGRRAHLIPYRNRKYCQCGHQMDEHRGHECSKCGCRQKRTMVECQLIIDYKGLVELVRRSGDVSYIHADVVFSSDEFSYAFGTDAHLRHKPSPDRSGERTHFYSYVKFKDGSEDFCVMTPAEVEKIRKRSKSPDNGPWATDYEAMGIKTAFRRHSKWLPLSPEVRRAVEDDDEAIDTTATATTPTTTSTVNFTDLISDAPQTPQIEGASAAALRDHILAKGSEMEGSKEPQS